MIPDAAQLTDAAANALLKTLEEPPAQTRSSSPVANPRVYWPRCVAAVGYITLHHRQSHTLSPRLTREVTASPEALLSALRLSAGSPGAALTLLQAESWTHRKEFLAALANTLQSGDWYILLAALNHDQAAARLHWLATLLTDALKRSYGISI